MKYVEDKGGCGSYGFFSRLFGGKPKRRRRRPSMRAYSRNPLHYSMERHLSSSSRGGYEDGDDDGDRSDRCSSDGSEDSESSCESDVLSESMSSAPSENSSSMSDSWCSADISDSDLSAEIDAEERARQAAKSFLRWKNKAYVPLSVEEKQTIKEYRRAVAMEKGTYMSSRATRAHPGKHKKRVEEGSVISLETPPETPSLHRRRSSSIRFTAAVVARRVSDLHNEEVVLVKKEGEEVPALPRSASILRKSSIVVSPVATTRFSDSDRDLTNLETLPTFSPKKDGKKGKKRK